MDFESLEAFAEPFHPEPIISAVYFLIQDDEIVYVGKTVDIRARINQHIAERDGRYSTWNRKEFNGVKFIRVDPMILDECEEHFMWKYRPKFNKGFCHNLKYYEASA